MFNKDVVLELINKRGWTKYRLAKEASISMSTLYEILNGKKKSPSSDSIHKIADALGVSMDIFYKDDVIQDIEDNQKNYLDNLNDKEVIELYEAMQKNEQLKIFYKKTKDLTPKDLRIILKLVEGIKQENE